MSITRKCDACEKVIQQKDYIELSAKILKTASGENQGFTEFSYGDFCAVCLASGEALKTLMKKLETAVVGEL